MWETSVKSGRQGGDKCKLDKCKLMQPQAPRVGDKGETSVQGTQSGKQGGDKCKLMRPKAPRVGDKEETSVNSCGPRNPEWDTSVGDRCGRREV